MGSLLSLVDHFHKESDINLRQNEEELWEPCYGANALEVSVEGPQLMLNACIARNIQNKDHMPWNIIRRVLENGHY